MEYKQEIKNCQNCKCDFTIEPEDFNFYEKIKVPPPTFCPECRFQRRLLFRNNRVFYRRECFLCKKNILSVYSKEKPFIVYCKECWLSDKWNPLDYGTDYDFSKSFFEQFKSLQLKVPRSNLYQTNFISSEYCNYGLDLKECYLLFGGINNERVYFGNQIFDSQDSLDVAFSEKVQFSYELFECARSNLLFFSRNCNDCVESRYLIDCRNCINCFCCVGLVNKSYCIFNEQKTKEEYEKFIKLSSLDNFEKHQEFLNKLEKIKLSIPHRYAYIYKSINSDGDDLYEVRNTHNSFSSRQAENSKYLFFSRNNTKDSYDTSFQGFNAEFLYEIAHGFGGSNSAFGVRNFSNQNVRYTEECHDCLNIFGCEGLYKKEYCILNRQYTKEEYEKLVPKIIKHMNEVPFVDNKGCVYKYGEFFPKEASPFAYNESIAQEYFPLSKEEILEHGYIWKESEIRNYDINIKTEDIPNDVENISEDILNKVIACEHGGKCKDQCTEAFKIVSEELKFYKRMNLPLPRLCPNCRHYKRINLRNPLKLWHRKCMKNGCNNEFETTYSPERLEIIYCEKCYQQEVY
ncbi:MAG: hypothetical protein NDI62_01980 [Burkholderiales bacterium]|nr:hypothetical protein [Burkholderiales bacterium]